MRRNLKVDKEGREFIMTNVFPDSEYKDSFEGKEVYQIVPVDSYRSMYAVHFKPHMIALYNFSQQIIMKNFSSFPTLKSISSLHNMVDLPCILIRDENSIQVFNLEN